MDAYISTDDKRVRLKNKLRQYSDGKIVRKDLTKKIKEGANVPVYVLEFLLGQYCSSDDPEIIEQGVSNVKHILSDNFVRPVVIKRSFQILESRISRYQRSTLRSMTACCAAGFGALFVWNMSLLRRTRRLLRSILSSWIQFRCRILILMS